MLAARHAPNIRARPASLLRPERCLARPALASLGRFVDRRRPLGYDDDGFISRSSNCPYPGADRQNRFGEDDSPRRFCPHAPDAGVGNGGAGPAAIHRRFFRLSLVGLIAALAARALANAADEPASGEPASARPAADQPQPAKPAESLAGELVRVRPKEEASDDSDLLSTVDLAKDVVYRDAESPTPVADQFQFIDGVLRTPEKGDARLCLPADVPRFYRLTLDLVARPEATDPTIGIGALLDGQACYVQLRAGQVTLGRFYDHEITKPLATRALAPNHPAVRGAVELLVGDRGMLVRNRAGLLEWIAPGSALSLDERWQSSLPGKLFLVFPNGQFDLRSVQLTPLERQQWVDQVRQLMPEGQIATLHAEAEPATIDPQVRSAPRSRSASPGDSALGPQRQFRRAGAVGRPAAQRRGRAR